MADFTLTISVDEVTVAQGENFKIKVELKNQSGEDRHVRFSLLLWPSIPDWNYLDPGVEIEMPEPQQIFLENNTSLKNIGFWGNEAEHWEIGADLQSGTYELKFLAKFTSIDEQGNEKVLEIWSNTILLTVQ